MKHLCIFQSAVQTSQLQHTAPEPPEAQQPDRWPCGPLLWAGASWGSGVASTLRLLGQSDLVYLSHTLQGGRPRVPCKAKDPGKRFGWSLTLV